MVAIPDFTSVGAATPRPAPPPRASGAAPVADAIEGAGQQLEQFGEKRYQREQTIAETAAKSAYYRQVTDLKDQIQQDPDSTQWQKKFEDGEAKIRANVGANLRGTDTRNAFDAAATMHGVTVSSDIGSDARTRLKQNQRAGLFQNADENIDTAISTTDQANSTALLKVTNEAWDAGVHSGVVTAEEAKAGKRQNALRFAKGRADSLDPEAAYTALTAGMSRTADGQVQFAKTNTWADAIPIDERQKLIQSAEVDIEHQRVIKDRAQKEQSDQAAGQYITNLITDPGKVSARAIANDPNLDWRTKNELVNIQRARIKEIQSENESGANKDAKTYGSAFDTIYHRVNAPDGSPDKITDATQLYPLVGKGLTVSGVDKLRSEIEGKRTPEGEAESQMKNQFFKNARGEITGSDEGLHFRDPKGDELYLKFMARSLGDFDAGKKSGKTAAQLLNPDSPDYVGKSISTFKRPMSQWIADQVDANGAGDAAAPGAPAIQPLPAEKDMTSDQLKAFVASGRINRRNAENIAIRKGWIAAGNPQSPKPLLSTVPPATNSPLHLDPRIAPKVPDGAPRPFAPGEYVDNPDGSWSSEISMTVEGDKRFNGGKPTVIPSIWIIGGKPVRAKNEDEAVEYALKSGLKFKPFNSIAEAEKFATDREDVWQKVGRNGAGKIPPLWVKQ